MCIEMATNRVQVEYVGITMEQEPCEGKTSLALSENSTVSDKMLEMIEQSSSALSKGAINKQIKVDE